MLNNTEPLGVMTSTKPRRTQPSILCKAIIFCSFVIAEGNPAKGQGTDPDLMYFAGGNTADTSTSIDGQKFLIDGVAPYQGQIWNGVTLEGLLLNSRMVNGTYDDLDGRPPSGMLPWDARLNTEDFVAQMPQWAALGLRAITLNFQGGANKCHGLSGNGQFASVVNNPYGASGSQAFGDWKANRDTGHARYLSRIGSIIRSADDLGMVVILGLFYFGQDEGLRDEAAVLAAVDSATDWVVENRWTNVLIEINNEADLHYDHAVLRPARVHELMQRVKARSSAKGAHLPHGRLLVSSSLRGGAIPSDTWITNSDFVLLHGNGQTASGLQAMVDVVRARSSWKANPKPIVFNEDSTSTSNFRAAVQKNSSWGYYDDQGYQCVYPSTTPDRWTVAKATNANYWPLLAEITNASATGSAIRVETMTLIDADRDAAIASHDPLRSGATINLATLPTRNLSIRANTSPPIVGSVRFTLDGKSYSVESSAPYALAGDGDGDYYPWTPTVGAHTLVATPTELASAGGLIGDPLSISFTVIDQPNVPPTVTLTSPAQGATFTALATIRLVADAEDDTGPVEKVEFLADGRKIGEDASDPYELVWPSVPAGTYALAARAVDSAGASTTSPTISIQVLPGEPSSPAVYSLTLMDADSNQPIAGYDPIGDGAVLDLDSLPTRRLSVRANTWPAEVGSVSFELNGGLFRVESAAPYALAGDSEGDYYPWTPGYGSYVLIAAPYSGAEASGTPGSELRVGFTVR